ncbi:hypothetical protein [Streptacidiphilus rugosus]|nr:hypothetical protein [Streptacidiphilus rugosus]
MRKQTMAVRLGALFGAVLLGMLAGAGSASADDHLSPMGANPGTSQVSGG